MLFDFDFYLDNEYQLKRVQFKTSLFIVKIMFENYLCTYFTNKTRVCPTAGYHHISVLTDFLLIPNQFYPKKFFLHFPHV